MTFNVKARVLLELGAELISSDGIALYELIKNSVDAGSESVEIRVNVGLAASGYRVLRSKLESLPPGTRLRREWLIDASQRYFESTASDTVREEFVGRLEGVGPQNAATLAEEFYREFTFIEVEDWGCGMSIEDLKTKFLTVGTPNRANERRRLGIAGKLLGEKGIGRLSAMRLGLVTEVITGTTSDRHWATLDIDWSTLRDDPDLDLDQFSAEPIPGVAKRSGDEGTLVRIRDLQSDWSFSRMSVFARAEFSKLQDPFETEGAILDLKLLFNGKEITTIEELDTDWLNKWHGYFDISFAYKKMNPEDPEDLREQPFLSGTAKFRLPKQPDAAEPIDVIDGKDIAASGDGLYSLLASTEYSVAGGVINDAARFDGIDTLGEFKAEGYWFNRQRAQQEFGDQYEKFKFWLEQWAGGLLVYRDGYRVYPYAAPDDDWLELDQRALRRKSFKLNRGQFVGYVRITSLGNRELRDQTNRQGLCDTPEKRALVQCLQHVIWKELGALVTKHEERVARQSLSTVREIEKQVSERAKDAKIKLRDLAKRIPGEHQTIADLRGYVEELEAAWAAAKKTLKKQAGQAELYLHLAGVGMLLEFVIHELNRVTGATLQDLQKVDGNALPPGLRSLSRQLQTLDKRLRILDPVSTPGRQRKEDADIVDILQTLLDAHEQQFERHEIAVTLIIKPQRKTLISKVVVGQAYQIFENLISNSVYWLSHHRAMKRVSSDTKFDAKIEIEVGVNDRAISFRDNGPGIEWADREKIFEPFFSKKPSGRGIGLYIVRSLCRENDIALSLLGRSADGTVPGFKFEMP
jgi:signal transduction histidine kinase